MRSARNEQNQPTIYAENRGESGPTVVLVHGLPSSLREWDGLAQELVDRGCRTIAVDLPGMGQSFKPEEREFYTTDQFYACFETWLRDLRLDPAPVLIGHSFGGHLCLRYAREHPQDVRGLVLIDPFLAYRQLRRFNRFWLAYPRGVLPLMKYTPTGLIRLFLWVGSLEIRKRRVASSLSASELRQMVRDYQRSSPQILYLPQTVSDIAANLADLQMPACLVWGRQDPTLSVAWYERAAVQWQHVTCKAVRGGHYPHRTNAGEVNRIVMEFMVQTDAPQFRS